MAEHMTEITPRETQRLGCREPFSAIGSPFRMLEPFADEWDHVLDDFARGWSTPRWGRRWITSPLPSTGANPWAPDIEMSHRNNELVVRADLPGLKKDDVKVDVREDGITIEGERQHEQESERSGFYRSERSYGSFYRTIPLPEGVMVDQAKASFTDGVLEITMPAPPEQVTRGRRLEIREGTEAKK